MQAAQQRTLGAKGVVPRSREYFSLLTPARFVAALGVLMLHAWSASLRDDKMPAFIRAGYLGVPFFFVLSGFVLMHGHVGERTLPEAKAFWWRRFATIYPAYLLGLVITAPLFISLMRTEMAPPSEIALKGAAAVGLVQSWSLTTALEWNAPGWTLACEAFFYLLFPLLAPWFSKLSGRQALGAIGALWALALVRFLPLGRDPWWLTISPIARLPEFLMGMCASVLLVSMLPETRRRIRLPIAIGALVIIALAFALHDRIGRAVLDCGTLGPVFAALIVALAFYGDMPVPKIATKLGESSYDLYVIQIGVMAIAGKCLSVVHVPAYSPLRFIVLVLAVIIASRFVHRWISRPSRQRLLRLSKRSSTPSTEPARPLP